MSRDKLLEKYDSYLIRHTQESRTVWLCVELISNRWWRFNKKVWFAAEQNDTHWWAGTTAKTFIARCEKHFGY